MDDLSDVRVFGDWRLIMEKRIEYQVLAPNSVAWFIQAALVADRSGNAHSRDLALAEAQRIAAERRLVERPAPEGSRVLAYDVAHECNGVRLAEMEKIISSLHEHQVLDARRVEKLVLAQQVDHRTMHATFNEHQTRLEALENAPTPVADGNWMGRIQKRLDEIESKLKKLDKDTAGAEQGHATGVAFVERTLEGRTGPEAGLDVPDGLDGSDGLEL